MIAPVYTPEDQLAIRRIEITRDMHQRGINLLAKEDALAAAKREGLPTVPIQVVYVEQPVKEVAQQLNDEHEAFERVAMELARLDHPDAKHSQLRFIAKRNTERLLKSLARIYDDCGIGAERRESMKPRIVR